MVTVGLTIIIVAIEPVFQKYTEPPDADKAADLPEQITVLEGVMVIAGSGFTVTPTTELFVHKAALVTNSE